MAKTEAAKALEAKQKAAVKAEKDRKKNSSDPRDWGTMRAIRELYKMTTKKDPKFGILLFAALLGPFLLVLITGLILMFTIGFRWWNVLLLSILGLLVGAILAQWLLARRGKQAALAQYEGQAGSGEVALGMLPKDWTHTPVIAFTRQQDVVHRAIGPGGLFLIGEGEPGRVRQLLAQEVKRHNAVLYGIEARTVMLGNGANQVSLQGLTKWLTKQSKTLDKTQIEEAAKRLKALDGTRRMPIPQGPMATRGSRSSMRGR